jgi:hypothetical protein
MAGRMREAWSEYPEVRRRIAAVPPGAHIFLTGAPRSGTTWLGRMLAESGIWFVHEPFARRRGRWPRAFVYQRPGEISSDVDQVFGDVLAGGFRSALNLRNTDHPLMPLRLFRPRFQRLLVKDPLACLLADYLTDRFRLQTLVLFRHPAAFASSLMRLDWPTAAFLRHFLDDQALMADHLEPFRDLLAAHAAQDGVLAAAVLHGALCRVLWKSVEAGKAQPLVFEQLCASPLESLRELHHSLGLPYDERVRARHAFACEGGPAPPGGHAIHAVRRDSHAEANAWRARVDAGQLGRIRAIWERFDVPLYRDTADWTLAGAEP